jgi:branched-chain amino acid transport system permease protein
MRRLKPLAGAPPLASALIAAAIALVLGFPLIGFCLIDQGGGEAIETRWPALAVAAALVFVGRLLLGLIELGKPRAVLVLSSAAAGASIATDWPTGFLQAAAAGGAALIAVRAGWALAGSPAAAAGRMIEPVGRFAPWLLAAFALVLPALPFADRHVLDTGLLILIYAMLGWGLNIVTGLAGLLDLGYVAFYAIGAYTMAILAARFGLSFWACLPLSAVTASAAGLLLGFPVLRLRGDYFAIVTLGFGEIIRIVANNWRWLTNGSQGIPGPRPSFFGLADFTAAGPDSFSALFGVTYSPNQRVIFLYYLVMAFALAVNLFTSRIRRLPIGRAWEALREDEIACQALGIDRRRIKLAAFAIGAAWGGLAGAFYVARMAFITPESFGFIESVMITAIVVLGGLGSQLGVALAAIVLVGASELFRSFADYRMLVYGAAMIAIMHVRPRGLVSTRTPSVILR